MTSMGERMPRKEFVAMVKEVDKDNDGLINCQGKTTEIWFEALVKYLLHRIL